MVIGVFMALLSHSTSLLPCKEGQTAGEIKTEYSIYNNMLYTCLAVSHVLQSAPVQNTKPWRKATLESE